jgi:hypothetical protein
MSTSKRWLLLRIVRPDEQAQVAVTTVRKIETDAVPFREPFHAYLVERPDPI